MEVGDYLNLKIVRESEFGLYLSDGEDEVLLPENQCPDDALVGQSLKVFIYTDSEDRRIATRLKPKAVIGEFAYLECVSVSNSGAFFDWGLLKDLFCPFKEQLDPVQEGQFYMVRVYLDVLTQRVVCTTKLGKYLRSDGREFRAGDPVRIQILDKAPGFVTAIVNGTHKGAIFPDEWHTDIPIGTKVKGFIKRVRPDDGKIALSFRPQGLDNVFGERDRIIKALIANGGSLPFSDRSSPDQIQKTFGMSKGSFKKLIGSMYKEGVIRIEENSITLLSN